MTSQNHDVRVQRVDRSNFERVLPLIAAYQQFYEKEPDPERNRAFFGELIDDDRRGVMFGAFAEDGEAKGFATLYFIPSSLSAKTSCTFNDLYTVQDVRGAGVGVTLGLHCLMYAKERGFDQVSWITSPSNAVARKIYEYTNARCSDWCCYELDLDFPQLG